MQDFLNPQGARRDHSKPLVKGSEEWDAYFGKKTLNKGKKKKSPTNELTNAIQQYIQLIGGDAFRINTTGIYDENLGMYRTSGSTKGVSDLVAVIKGKFVGVEIKVGSDKQRPMQLKFQLRVEKAGGIYIIAKDFDSAKIEIDKLL